MDWKKATKLELCHIILFDETATEEDKRKAGEVLFSLIGADGRVLQSSGM